MATSYQDLFKKIMGCVTSLGFASHHQALQSAGNSAKALGPFADTGLFKGRSSVCRDSSTNKYIYMILYDYIIYLYDKYIIIYLYIYNCSYTN